MNKNLDLWSLTEDLHLRELIRSLDMRRHPQPSVSLNLKKYFRGIKQYLAVPYLGQFRTLVQGTLQVL